MQTVNVNGREWKIYYIGKYFVRFELVCEDPTQYTTVEVYRTHRVTVNNISTWHVADLPALVAHAKTLLNPEAK
jgi:hypothetical protein